VINRVIRELQAENAARRVSALCDVRRRTVARFGSTCGVRFTSRKPRAFDASSNSAREATPEGHHESLQRRRRRGAQVAAGPAARLGAVVSQRGAAPRELPRLGRLEQDEEARRMGTNRGRPIGRPRTGCVSGRRVADRLRCPLEGRGGQLTERQENYKLWTADRDRGARRARGAVTHYLLSGVARCAACGGSMQAVSSGPRSAE
jgi:hypothetical protein